MPSGRADSANRDRSRRVGLGSTSVVGLGCGGGRAVELVVFVGLQASGKSTFYRERFAASHVLVSKDLLRNNRRPQRRQMFLIAEALGAGRSVVVDNTNPTVADRAALLDLVRTLSARAIGFAFESSLAEILKPYRLREGTVQ